MSIQKLSQVMKTSFPDPIAKFVMVVLADHYNDSTGTCWPSIDTLAEVTGVSRRTVIRKLKDLEAAGYIIRRKRFNKTDIYEIFIGDNLTRDTVSPLGVTGWHTNSYRTLNKQKKKRQTVDDNYLPSDDLKAKINAKHEREIDHDTETYRFINYHQARGTLFANIDSGYRNWCAISVNKSAKANSSKASTGNKRPFRSRQKASFFSGIYEGLQNQREDKD